MILILSYFREIS